MQHGICKYAFSLLVWALATSASFAQAQAQPQPAALPSAQTQAQPQGQPQLHHRARYLLRSGDTLDLQYRLTPEFNQTVMVQPDGYINLNEVGTMYVAGMTVDQAHDLIVEKVSSKLKDPELTIALESFTHPYIVVAGQVAKPGQIELKENTTAIGAVMLAGGFTPNAKAGQVILFRKMNDSIAEVKILHLSHLHKTAQLEHDIALEPGDIIYVPQDTISKIEHYMQVANIGMYVNPLQFAY